MFAFVLSLTPLSTALVISRRSVHLPMFSWLSHTGTYTTFFRSHWLLSHIDQRWEAMEKIARKNVAATGYRTRDLQITIQIRYQLSYKAGPFVCVEMSVHHHQNVLNIWHWVKIHCECVQDALDMIDLITLSILTLFES